jgi:hypothetical protein
VWPGRTSSRWGTLRSAPPAGEPWTFCKDKDSFDIFLVIFKLWYPAVYGPISSTYISLNRKGGTEGQFLQFLRLLTGCRKRTRGKERNNREASMKNNYLSMLCFSVAINQGSTNRAENHYPTAPSINIFHPFRKKIYLSHTHFAIIFCPLCIYFIFYFNFPCLFPFSSSFKLSPLFYVLIFKDFSLKYHWPITPLRGGRVLYKTHILLAYNQKQCFGSGSVSGSGSSCW